MQRLSEFLMSKYGEVAAAVVVLEKGAQLTEEQIKEEMLKRWQDSRCRSGFFFLDAIPKTLGLRQIRSISEHFFKRKRGIMLK